MFVCFAFLRQSEDIAVAGSRYRKHLENRLKSFLSSELLPNWPTFVHWISKAPLGIFLTRPLSGPVLVPNMAADWRGSRWCQCVMAIRRSCLWEINRRLFVRKPLKATLFLTCCDWLNGVALSSIHEELSRSKAFLSVTGAKPTLELISLQRYWGWPVFIGL